MFLTEFTSPYSGTSYRSDECYKGVVEGNIDKSESETGSRSPVEQYEFHTQKSKLANSSLA